MMKLMQLLDKIALKFTFLSVKRDEIPVTEVNKKIDFKTLENEDIMDSNNYSINGRVITNKNKVKKLS